MNEFDCYLTSKEKLKEKIIIMEDLVESIEESIKLYKQRIDRCLEKKNDYEGRDLAKLYKESKRELEYLYGRLPIEKEKLAYYKYCLEHFENVNLEDEERIQRFIEIENEKRERDNRLTVSDDETAILLEKREKIRKKLIKIEKGISLKPYLILMALVTIIATGIFCYTGMPFWLGLSFGLPTGAMAAAFLCAIKGLLNYDIFEQEQKLKDELEYLNNQLEEIRVIEHTKGLEKAMIDAIDVPFKEEAKTTEKIIEKMTDVEQLKKLRDKINREIEGKEQEQVEIKGREKVKK